MRNKTHLHCILSIFVFLVIHTQVVLSSSSSSSYVPVTALDKYGNSIQLQNARQAAIRHGRLVVAIRATSAASAQYEAIGDNAIIVVASLYTPKLGQRRPSSSSCVGVLHPLWIHSNDSSSTMTTMNGGVCSNCSYNYLACTGIKADVVWLVRTLRQYAKRLWDRYASNEMSNERLIHALSLLLQQFMSYNRSREYSDGVGVIENDGDGDDTNAASSSWGRPLGIQTLLLSLTSPIVLVEPSGVVLPSTTTTTVVPATDDDSSSPSCRFSYEFVAIGKDSDGISRALLRERRRYRSSSSSKQQQNNPTTTCTTPNGDGAATTTSTTTTTIVQDMKDMLIDVIRQQVVQQEQGSRQQRRQQSSTEIIFEVVTKEGIVEESSVLLIPTTNPME